MGFPAATVVEDEAGVPFGSGEAILRSETAEERAAVSEAEVDAVSPGKFEGAGGAGVGSVGSSAIVWVKGTGIGGGDCGGRELCGRYAANYTLLVKEVATLESRPERGRRCCSN